MPINRMIMTKTPLRITFVGGGTDIQSFYKKHGPGAVVSAAINKYIYIIVNKKFDGKIRVSYSTTEIVDRVDELKHPTVREALKLLNIDGGIEIVSISDIPSEGTGLGSSSSFLVGLLNALHAWKGELVSQRQLAEEAVKIEREILKEPGGKQDQYIAAYGGIQYIEFNKDESVIVKPIVMEEEKKRLLRENLILMYTGKHRKSTEIHKNQMKETDNKVELYGKMRDLAEKMYESLSKGKIEETGRLLHENWLLKKQLTAGISDNEIDVLYDKAISAGAEGGKLCLTPEMFIKTESGFKEIKDINIGESVYDHQHALQEVSKVIKTEYDGKILEIKLNGVESKLKITPEHPVLTTKKSLTGERIRTKGKSGGKLRNLLVIKGAEDLKEGEVLLIPVNKETKDVPHIRVEKEVGQSKYSNHDIYDGIPEKVEVGYDLLNLIGWYIAEGSANRKQFQIALNKKELNYAIEISKNVENLFKKKMTLKDTYKTKTNGIYLIGTSVVISHFLRKQCGVGAVNKQIPEFAMSIPEEKQAILLRALWKGDGTVMNNFDKRTNNHYIRCNYKTVSIKLAKQVQELCLRLGFIPNIRKEIPEPFVMAINKNKKLTYPKPVYNISLYGEDAAAFKGFVDNGKLDKIIRSNKKQLSLSKEFVEIEGFIYAKRSIKEIKNVYYKGYVYNLNVGNSHTYIANDIAVHNCGAGGGGFLLFYASKEKHKAVSEALKLKLEPFDFEALGSRIIHVGE